MPSAMPPTLPLQKRVVSPSSTSLGTAFTTSSVSLGSVSASVKNARWSEMTPTCTPTPSMLWKRGFDTPKGMQVYPSTPTPSAVAAYMSSSIGFGMTSQPTPVQPQSRQFSTVQEEAAEAAPAQEDPTDSLEDVQQRRYRAGSQLFHEALMDVEEQGVAVKNTFIEIPDEDSSPFNVPRTVSAPSIIKSLASPTKSSPGKRIVLPTVPQGQPLLMPAPAPQAMQPAQSMTSIPQGFPYQLPAGVQIGTQLPAGAQLVGVAVVGGTSQPQVVPAGAQLVGVGYAQPMQAVPAPVEPPPAPVSPPGQAMLPSKGSADHDGTGRCRPCAWFWKPQGCKSAYDCEYCHICGEDELRKRKKVKVQAIRAGALQPQPTHQGSSLHQGPREPRVLKISAVI
eukprot:gnl/TRDRNA2_/TRDRNA2_187893_c0_seq1.p1 gnl/TRDRNA2_/TRDRNA2_187893_c0~~gnl/TRDRNA2_/TRDRNA2_187893_c0_seq1.p1  ORF type:complete len:394 (+),score=50.88 gnl/TRDRNA2_/TRDRNA2_187893_c0_seq1:71-1252(+)